MKATLLAICICAACTLAVATESAEPATEEKPTVKAQPDPTYATFGMGCFWCGEAVFQQLDGVRSVISGYEGGHIDDPTYDQVCSGKSGHAEVIRVEYDPATVKFDALLDLFWKAHDPTQLNRQDNDIGTQYRSVIFYHSDEQGEAALASKKKLAAAGTYKNPVVTEISPSKKFYSAEKYHQDYFKNNPGQPYCRFIIAPKLKKLGMDEKTQ